MQCRSVKKKFGVVDLVNQPLLSNFEQHVQDIKESIYASNKLAPLGENPVPDLPAEVTSPSWTFGRMTDSGDTVKDLMSPCTLCGTAGLLGDSPDNSPGSYCNRAGTLLGDSIPSGKKTGADMSGSGVKKTMLWCDGSQPLNLVPVPVDEFREKHQYCLGKALAPEQMKEKLPASYQFGMDMDPHADVMDQALTYNYENPIRIPRKGFRKEQGLQHTLRNLLKMKNYHYFDDLISAFKEYDENNNGKVTAHDIKLMCEKFGINVSLDLVTKLVSDSDLMDQDGLISYEEFIHFLNWKDKLPENYDYRVKAKKYHNEWIEGIVNTSEEVMDHFKTVTSISFAEPLSAPGPSAGIPTVRVDRQIPHVKRLRNRKHYGDIKDISSLLHPNVFTDHGVYDDDLHAPRSKEEVKQIFEKCDMQFAEYIFEDIWMKIQKNDRASVEAFRKALDKFLWSNHRCNTKPK